MLKSFQVESLKGYGRQYNFFLSQLTSHQLVVLSDSVYDHLIKNLAITPNEYSSRLTLEFLPDETALVCLRRILITLIPIIKANEQGILDDIDTEFLHDLRVAFRKTRSALSLIKKVLPDTLVNTYKVKFRNLVKQTNFLRDLDVYLMQENYYRSLLPEELRPSLDPFFQKLQNLRKIELERVIKLIRSQTYKKVMADWEKELQQDFSSQILPPKALLPVLPLVRKLIFKRYSKVIKLGTDIDLKTKDEQLHRIRIECKKIRYLINFFESLFDEETITLILKKLKRFQNKLGEFNDYSVQIDQLNQFLTEFSKEDKSGKITAALGGLITILHVKKDQLKANIKDDFNKFATGKNRAMFAQLFSQEIE